MTSIGVAPANIVSPQPRTLKQLKRATLHANEVTSVKLDIPHLSPKPLGKAKDFNFRFIEANRLI
jgi:hypothetical protein